MHEARAARQAKSPARAGLARCVILDRPCLDGLGIRFRNRATFCIHTEREAWPCVKDSELDHLLLPVSSSHPAPFHRLATPNCCPVDPENQWLPLLWGVGTIRGNIESNPVHPASYPTPTCEEAYVKKMQKNMGRCLAPRRPIGFGGHPIRSVQQRNRQSLVKMAPHCAAPVQLADATWRMKLVGATGGWAHM